MESARQDRKCSGDPLASHVTSASSSTVTLTIRKRWRMPAFSSTGGGDVDPFKTTTYFPP